MSPTAARRPASRTLGGLLAELSQRTPDRPAVVHEGTVVSFAELSRDATAAARALLALGVRRGDRVGVLLGNQPEWLSMCFGAASIGATLVPLNTWYKKQELEWTIRHCGLTVLVTAARFLKHDYTAMIHELVPEMDRDEPGEVHARRFPRLRAVAFVGDRAARPSWAEMLQAGAEVSGERLDQASRAVTPDDIAFILYTSGSTAEPKGVLLRQGSLVDNGFDIGARRGIRDEDTVWLGAPLFYGLGAANAMPATLTHGATLVLQSHFDAGTAIQLIRSTQATVYYGAGVGNMSQAILDHPTYARSKIATLQKGNAGISAAFKRLTIVEMGIRGATGAYGLTESYGHATGHEVDDPLEVKLHTNGTALPGFELVIVDPDSQRRLPAGETGLLLLRGHVTPGYFGAPTETARVLRSDGFFDTGDLGHLDREGRFVFHSRLKGVIKSGGINVSPSELEGVLMQHPSIRNAHVVGMPHQTRGEVPVAVVERRGSVGEDEVKEFVRERVASFKVPHHVLFRDYDKLPRLASGKIAGAQLVEEVIRELGLER